MDSVFAPPFQKIWARSINGGQLILRLCDPRGRWLRVHDNGELEVAAGDPRRDESRTSLRTLAPADPLLAQARVLHEELCRNFQANDLLGRSPFGSFYPVQAFAGPQGEIIEGHIGIEVEMGAVTDIFGFRDATRARSNHQTLGALLALI